MKRKDIYVSLYNIELTLYIGKIKQLIDHANELYSAGIDGYAYQGYFLDYHNPERTVHSIVLLDSKSVTPGLLAHELYHVVSDIRDYLDIDEEASAYLIGHLYNECFSLLETVKK